MRLAAPLALAGLLLGSSAAVAQNVSLGFFGVRPGAGTFCIRVVNSNPTAVAGELRRISPSPAVISGFNLAAAPAGGRQTTVVEAVPTGPGVNNVFTAFNLSGTAISGTATANTASGQVCTLLPPIVVPPPEEPGGEGPQRQIVRLFGGALFNRGYQVSDQIGFGFARGPSEGLGGGWNAWAAPRGISLSDNRSGVSADGVFSELVAGIDRHVTPDLILGMAFGGERLDGDVGTFNFKTRSDGFFLGPYVGWRVRPSTILDAWAGYARLDTSLSIPGERGDFGTDRFFLSLNATEIIPLGAYELRPRATLFLSQDQAGGFTTTSGARFSGDRYSYSFVEATVELSRLFQTTAGALRPFLRPGLRYELDRPVDEAVRTDGTTKSLERTYGQIRGGLRWQIAPAVEISASVGYLSLFVPGVDAWEGRGLVSVLF